MLLFKGTNVCQRSTLNNRTLFKKSHLETLYSRILFVRGQWQQGVRTITKRMMMIATREDNIEDGENEDSGEDEENEDSEEEDHSEDEENR